MPHTEAEQGHIIQVGDIVQIRNAYGSSKMTIDRVTSAFAFVKLGTTGYQMKFPRVYDESFRVLPRLSWDKQTYIVLRGG